MSLQKQPKHVIRWEKLNKLQRLNYIWVNILSFDMMIKPFFFFLAVLGLHCDTRAFSSWGQWAELLQGT